MARAWGFHSAAFPRRVAGHASDGVAVFGGAPVARAACAFLHIVRCALSREWCQTLSTGCLYTASACGYGRVSLMLPHEADLLPCAGRQAVVVRMQFGFGCQTVTL